MTAAPAPTEIARELARLGRLCQRRFELLPLAGPAAAFAAVQGRGPGASTTPAELAELISSIATVGVLQPILVEELPGGDRRLVAGERRLRAAKWGAVNLPDNPHFAAIPAVVCPGPLSEEQRRVWQLVENLAREDLQPGELAAALLYERCAVLTARLLEAGVPVAQEFAELDDPVARFRALDRLRLAAGQSRLGAPWEEVLRRLGLQLSARRVGDMVRAFAALPPELSTQMDAAKVTLATRLSYLELDRGRRAAAAELWAAVKAAGRPELLAAAVREQLTHPDVNAAQALAAAQTLHQQANAARSRTQRRGSAAAPEIADSLVRGALGALRELLAALRGGGRLDTYDAGSLRLFGEELLNLLAVHDPAGVPADGPPPAG